MTSSNPSHKKQSKRATTVRQFLRATQPESAAVVDNILDATPDAAEITVDLWDAQDITTRDSEVELNIRLPLDGGEE